MPDAHHLGQALREPIAPISPPASLEARVLAVVAADGRLAPAPRARRKLAGAGDGRSSRSRVSQRSFSSLG